MAKSSRPSSQKRAREKAQIERHKEKLARRMERKEQKATAGPRLPGEDPDLAGMRPGPQPLDPDLFDLPEEETSEEETPAEE
jgi:hypothetical protein